MIIKDLTPLGHAWERIKALEEQCEELQAKLDIAVKALEDSKSRLLELRDEELVKDLSVFKSCAMRIYSDIDVALKKLEEK